MEWVQEQSIKFLDARNAQLERQYKELPDPPEGWRWVLREGPTIFGTKSDGGNMAMNALTYTAEVRYRWDLEEVEVDD